jgi:uncharacterized protein YdaU (DUF1376 family)
LFSSDYLLDGKVDDLPLEAQAILLRMWCVCAVEGSCPSQPTEIARKIRVAADKVQEYFQKLADFFEIRDRRMLSHRMEKERAKSEAARESVNHRYRTTDRTTDRITQSQSQSQSQSQNENQIQKAEEEENAPPAITAENLKDRWNKIPGIKLCKKIEGALLQKIQRLIKDHPPDWWIGFLTEIEKSNFLCGRAAAREGKKPFRADLDWVTGPINLGKIMSGKYDDQGSTDRTQPPPPPPKTDPIGRGQWRKQYGDPKDFGYD